MPKAKDVNPRKWSNHIVIYDDGNYSAIWGNYVENGDNLAKAGRIPNERCIGVRWNDNYPCQGRNPVWYVEPKFFTKSILLSIRSKLVKSTIVKKEEYIKNTLIALKEFLSTKA